MFENQRGVEQSAFMSSRGGPISGMEVSSANARTNWSGGRQPHSSNMSSSPFYSQQGRSLSVRDDSWDFSSWRKWARRILAVTVAFGIFLGLLLLTTDTGLGPDVATTTREFKEIPLKDPSKLPAVCVARPQKTTMRRNSSTSRSIENPNSPRMTPPSHQKSSLLPPEPVPLGIRMRVITPSLITLYAPSNQTSSPTSPSTTSSFHPPNKPQNDTLTIPEGTHLVFAGPFPFSLQTGAFRFEELLHGFRRALTEVEPIEKVGAKGSEMRRDLAATEVQLQRSFALPETFTLRLISLLPEGDTPTGKCMRSVVELYNTTPSIIEGGDTVLKETLIWPIDGIPSSVGGPYANYTSDSERQTVLSSYSDKVDISDELELRTEMLYHFASPGEKRSSVVITYVFDEEGVERTELLEGAYTLRYGDHRPTLQDVWRQLQANGREPASNWQYELEWFCLALKTKTISSPIERDDANPLRCAELSGKQNSSGEEEGKAEKRGASATKKGDQDASRTLPSNDRAGKESKNPSAPSKPVSSAQPTVPSEPPVPASDSLVSSGHSAPTEPTGSSTRSHSQAAQTKKQR